MINVENIIYGSEIKALNIDNTPSKIHLKNIKFLLNKVLIPIEKAWTSYCYRNKIGVGGINIIRGYISNNINDKLIIPESKDSAHLNGYGVDTVPINGNIIEYEKFLKNYFDNRNFDELIEEKPRCGKPSWIHISYKNQDGKQRKKIYRRI